MKGSPGSKLDVAVLCGLLGVGFGLVAGLTLLLSLLCVAPTPPSTWLAGVLGGLPLAMIYWGAWGVGCSVFAIPLLRHRSLKSAGIGLGTLLVVLAVSFSVVGGFWPQAIPLRGYSFLLIPTLLFLAACLVLRWILPETAPLCPRCSAEIPVGRIVPCSVCGWDTFFHRRARYARFLAFGIAMVLAVLLTMLVITGEHSCGYWGANAVVCINRGALVIYHDPVYYEGWFWADLDFVPMEGLVMWPLFADRVTLVPLWMILFPLLVLDLWAWRRTADVQAGFCHKCRYNLRGVASEVCPECGTNVTK